MTAGNFTNVWGSQYNYYINHFHKEKEDFFPIDLRNYADRDSIFSDPPVAPRLLEIIHYKNLLIIQSDLDEDWEKFSLHFAWILSERLNSSNSGEIKVEGMIGNASKLSAFVRSIRSTKEDVYPSVNRKIVFILLNAKPTDVALELKSARTVAQETGNYIVVFTRVSLNKWVEMGFESEDCFIKLQKWEAITQRKLEDHVKTKLSKIDLSQKQLQKITEILGTYQRTKTFVNSLTQKESELRRFDLILKQADPEKIRFFIDRLSAPSDEIRRWFANLDHNQKLLTVIVLFFDDLFADQLFRAVDFVYFRSLKKRDPNLRAYDYLDLQGISEFFLEYKSNNDQSKIQCRPDLKYELLKTVWQAHRQFLITVIPELNDILISALIYPDSLGAEDIPQMGNSKAQEQIIQSIESFFSVLGYRQKEFIDQEFLILSTHDHRKVRASAAKIVSKWRLFDEGEELKGLNRIIEFTLNLWEKFDTDGHWPNQEAERARENIYITLTLIHGKTILYDQPGKPNEKLAAYWIDAVEKGRDPRYSRLKDSLSRDLLTNVIKKHWQVFKPRIVDISREAEYLKPIADGLAKAYLAQPDEILQLLREWRIEAEQIPLFREIDQELDDERQKLILLIKTITAIATDYYEDREYGKFLETINLIEMYFVPVLDNRNDIPQIVPDIIEILTKLLGNIVNTEFEYRDLFANILPFLRLDEKGELAHSLRLKQISHLPEYINETQILVNGEIKEAEGIQGAIVHLRILQLSSKPLNKKIRYPSIFTLNRFETILENNLNFLLLKSQSFPLTFLALNAYLEIANSFIKEVETFKEVILERDDQFAAYSILELRYNSSLIHFYENTEKLTPYDKLIIFTEVWSLTSVSSISVELFSYLFPVTREIHQSNPERLEYLFQILQWSNNSEIKCLFEKIQKVLKIVDFLSRNYLFTYVGFFWYLSKAFLIVAFLRPLNGLWYFWQTSRR